MSTPAPAFLHLTLTHHASSPNIYILTLRRPPENRLTSTFCQEIIHALHHIQRVIGPNTAGALITRGADAKFWSTGLELEESQTNPFANTDGFYPMLHAMLDFPFPTVALMTGHVFGGAVLFALAHDYRVMNSKRGFVSMPPVDLGIYFNGIGSLPQLKLGSKVARKMLLEAHRWTGEEALADGIVDFIASPEEMFGLALDLAQKWAPKAKMGVYGVLRKELWGEAAEKFQKISYVHSEVVKRLSPAKL